MGSSPERDGPAGRLVVTDGPAEGRHDGGSDVEIARGESAGLVFPKVPALVSELPGGGLEIATFAPDRTLVVTGRFRGEVEHFLRAGELGPMLAALPAEHALRAALGALGGAEGLALSPASALALEGLDTLFVELTGACTARCEHCYAEAGEGVESALSQACCEAVLRDAVRLGVRRVQLTGGEPLLCPFLPELVRLAAELEVEKCEIFTNGMLLDDEMLSRLAPHGPAFAFSFYSDEAEIHDGITRTSGSHGLTSAAIRRVVAAGLEVRVAVIVMEANADRVEQTEAYVRGLGAEDVSAGASFQVGRGELFRGSYSSGARPVEDAGKCRDYSGKLCVSHDGTVYPCIFNRTTALGRVPDRSLVEIARQPALPEVDSLSDEDFVTQTQERLACVECRLTALALRRLGRRL